MDDTRTDEVLMEGICLGQADAFEEIVRRYENRLFATAYRSLRNHDTAEDVLQETFTAVWEKRFEFNKNIAKFSTWVYNILANQINMALRARYRAKGTVSLSAVEEDKDTLTIGRGRESWFETLSEKRLAKLKEIVLQYLTEKEQTLYHLKEEIGLSCEEISRRPPFQGVKVATLQKRRQRYLGKIIAVLKKEGL